MQAVACGLEIVAGFFLLFLFQKVGGTAAPVLIRLAVETFPRRKAYRGSRVASLRALAGEGWHPARGDTPQTGPGCSLTGKTSWY
jgi:hypothetical protein